MWIRIGSGVGILRTRQRTSGSMKGNEFLDQMSDYQLAKESDARTQIRHFVHLTTMTATASVVK